MTGTTELGEGCPVLLPGQPRRVLHLPRGQHHQVLCLPLPPGQPSPVILLGQGQQGDARAEIAREGGHVFIKGAANKILECLDLKY